MRWSPRALLLVLVFSAGVILGFWFRGCEAVDRCLDRGGRWDKEHALCERDLAP